MKICIDSDEVSLTLRDHIYAYLKEKGYDINNLDYLKTHTADYPDVAIHLANKVAAGEYNKGILFCGTGIGMAIMANKVPGVYAGTCSDVYSAQRLVRSNNGNIITCGSRVVGEELVKLIIDNFLTSDFESNSPSKRKVDRLRQLEKDHAI